jgi:hypothetical protein
MIRVKLLILQRSHFSFCLFSIVGATVLRSDLRENGANALL